MYDVWVLTCVEINQCFGCFVERVRNLSIATPSSRRRVDGVEVDAKNQHERAVKFDFHTGPDGRRVRRGRPEFPVPRPAAGPLGQYHPVRHDDFWAACTSRRLGASTAAVLRLSMFVTLALVYVAAMRRASAGLRRRRTDADDETRDILRQQKRTVACVKLVASVVAIMSTFVAIHFPDDLRFCEAELLAQAQRGLPRPLHRRLRRQRTFVPHAVRFRDSLCGNQPELG